MEPEVAKAHQHGHSFDKLSPSSPPELSAWPQSNRAFITGEASSTCSPGKCPSRAPWPEPPFALQCREALPRHKWPPEGWWMPGGNPFHPLAKFPDSHTIDDPPLEIPTRPTDSPTASQGCPQAQFSPAAQAGRLAHSPAAAPGGHSH